MLDSDRSTQGLNARPEARPRKVLNVGSGQPSPRSLHPMFRLNGWHEERFDIDPLTHPDRVGSIADLGRLVEPASFDALWCSHALEHLHAHEIDSALASFRRALRADGFALITCPDLEAVVSAMLDKGLDVELYRSPAGPISALDMLFGHSASIARGNAFMAHNTGFTTNTMGNALIRAGFTTVAVLRSGWDLWAAACLDMTDNQTIQRELQATGLNIAF